MKIFFQLIHGQGFNDNNRVEMIPFVHKNIFDAMEIIVGQMGQLNINLSDQSRNEEVFKNLSMNIKNGTKVAFVGTSGCGKSTIMQMLQRFYDPTEGKIIINGNDIKDYDIKYLRKNFGVVSQ